ncbi:MAG TPA: ABC transporter permease subunit [Anaerolineales bacterium]|nr:ABC transporter permease subunit [Anaerolineales bacterium]
MTQITTSPPSEPKSKSLWRVIFGYLFDVRVLGVLGQIGFILLVVFGVRLIGSNFAENAIKLGEAQFICRDGTFSYRCAYDFMSSEAGFDIADTMLEYTNTDPYWRAISIGILNTLKVGIIGVLLTAIVGTIGGISRLSKNWLISKLALGYVELMRNTPLLIQIFFVYFGVILVAPELNNAAQPLGLPIYFSRRGLNLPAIEFTSSASIWVAFLILGIIQFQVLWILLGRHEERTGQPTSRVRVGILAFLIVAGIGWFVSSAVSETQGMMVTTGSRIRELSDIERLMLQRTGLNHIDEVSKLTEEELNDVALQVCIIKDSASEYNLTRQLRQLGIPYKIHRSDRPDQATEDYINGDCEVFAASKSILAAERATLENANSNLVIPIKEIPVVWSIPTREGLNLVGGAGMKPEFTALLLALVLFYGGTLSEIVRAGILSVSKGQTEAARALGLSEGQRLQLVVLPQALRVIIPPGIGVALSLAKDTSLGIAIGFPDMYAVAYTTMNQSGRVLQLFVLIMAVYMLISLGFSVLLNWYNDKIKLVER